MDATTYLDGSAVFVKVVEMGSFSAAARELNVPTSTVSRRVQRLEDVLGARLLQRSTRKLVMTDVGAEFFRRVSPAIEAVEQASDLVRGYSNEPCGTVRITGPADLAAALGGAIARFTAACPSMTVELTATNRRVDLIGEGFDLAVRAGKLEDSALIAKKLGQTDFWMAAAPSYLEARGTPRRIEQLEKHECVLFRAMGKRWPMVGPKGELTVQVEGRIIADDLGAIRGAVIAGAGIGFLPAMSLGTPLERGELVRVLPRYSLPGTPLHVVYPSAQHLPAKVAALRDFLIADFATAFA